MMLLLPTTARRAVRALTISLTTALVILGCLTIGGDARAEFRREKGSYTSPAAELVLPFDATANKATFLVVSNVNSVRPVGDPDASTEKVSTHWIFWNDDCDELIDFSICLTKNDTVVVDPRDLQSIGPNNERFGPKGNLDGNRGIVTVIAYETDDACSAFGSGPGGPAAAALADDILVGTYTLADTTKGYSFGGDALGLGVEPLAEGEGRHVVVPGLRDVAAFDIQTFSPTQLDASQVVLTHLRAFEEPNAIVEPSGSNLKFTAEFYDNQEVRTSLPDVAVKCAFFEPILDGLAPDYVALSTAGFVRLTPSSTRNTDFLWGFHGMAVGKFGAVVTIKVVPEPVADAPES